MEKSGSLCLLALAVSQLGTCGLSAFAGHSTTARRQIRASLSTLHRQTSNQRISINLTPPDLKSEHLYQPYTARRQIRTSLSTLYRQTSNQSISINLTPPDVKSEHLYQPYTATRQIRTSLSTLHRQTLSLNPNKT